MIDNLKLGDIVGYIEDDLIHYAFLIDNENKNHIFHFLEVDKEGDTRVFYRKIEYMKIIKVIKNHSLI